MTSQIHPTALIAESARLGEGVTIGPFCVIEERSSLGAGSVLAVGCVLSAGTSLGSGATLGSYVTVGANATLGQGVTIGDHTTIYPETVIGDHTFIGSQSAIGRLPRAAATSTVKASPNLPPLQIGKGSTIGCVAVLYAGTTLGEGVFVGDRALIRERCTLAEKVVVGSGSAVENDTRIGAYTKIQTGSYITAYMEIEERVFIAPMVSTTNDNYMGRTEKRFGQIRGATIRRGARIGGGAILLPAVEVAEETFVAAGSLVTKDTQPRTVVKGFPAQAIRAVPEEELLDISASERKITLSIPLLDLKAQYLAIKEEIDQAVLGVLDSTKFILGPEMKALEEEIAAYCGTKHAVAVGNGTDALVLALHAAGIGPGDEVITSPYTFFASAETISNVGATAVFADVDPITLNLDMAKVEAKITPRTKGIIPVHIFGQMADMDQVMDLAQRYHLRVIEDCAQAIGAEYKGRKAGSIGEMGTFSFFPTKNLGAYGDGGMVVTSDDGLAEKIRVLRFHGCRTKYYHDEIGYNSRLDEIQAAILRVKFKYLDGWNQGRRDKAAFFDQLLAPLATQGKVVLPGKAPERTHVYHLYVLRSDQRDQIAAALEAQGIASGVYYPVPLHLQKAFAHLGYRAGDMPVAEKACSQALAIPCYPELTQAQQEQIVQVIHQAL